MALFGLRLCRVLERLHSDRDERQEALRK